MVNKKFVLNKVFTGSYVNSELGHEFKNFLVCDDGTRGIYIVPHGRIGSKNVEYVIHVIGTEYNEYKHVYELIGISKVKKIFISDDEIKDILNKTVNGINFKNIFNEEIEVKSFSGIANKFFVPKNKKRVLIRTKQENNSFTINDDVIIIGMSEKKFGRGEANHIFPTINEAKQFEILFNKHFEEFFIEEKKSAFDINKLRSELPFCFISSRVRLELAISNMISYFLKRDPILLNNFINIFLGIKTDGNEKFEICREEKNIDLILKSNKRIIVIENKIDSNINGIKSHEYSQLSKYVEYVNEKYSNYIKHFFILKADYNIIDSSKYKYGEKYIVKNYGELFSNVLRDHIYRKEYKYDEYSQFLFDEFKLNIEYLSWSKSKQKQLEQMTLLKQIIDDQID
ncbi:MAG: PD-(D/E)XK nuclease family protein [Mycoplasma sp.]|nr:PD-(D/E)XK nuclease family protein [Mycoplasma sp.]